MDQRIHSLTESRQSFEFLLEHFLAMTTDEVLGGWAGTPRTPRRVIVKRR
jgi:hypothetical protein